MDFKEILSQKRIPVETPENVIDENGKAVFGTFKSEFPKMDFLKIKGQSPYTPDWYNRFRYTMWEAVEVNLKDALLLTAVCDMGWFRTALTCFYDKKTKKLTWWKKTIGSKNATVSYNLLNGDTTECVHKDLKIKIVNHFERGNAYIMGCATNAKKGDIKYDITLERVSLPSVVSIPFGENKPLYTQKDMFRATGFVEFGGRRYECDDDSAGIIDDHRGYYPYIAHYDWVTTMGRSEINGEKKYFGFNLTRNQSVCQTDYNENLIWFEGETSRLTPVRFEHIEYNKWRIRDVYGMVDIIFDIGDRYIMRMPYVVIDVNYHITFGELKGYVCDEEGNKYILDGMSAIGEDKSLHF